MRTGKLPYKSLSHTLQMIKRQVIDSLPYARRIVPNFQNPEQLYKWLKPKLHFKDDPKGVEYLQTMQTLMRNGGQGDCDCFVITVCACVIVQGWDNLYIDLTGYDRKGAVHIYNDLIWKGERVVLDFTNGYYNHERESGTYGKYKFRQRVPVRYQNWLLN